MLICLIPATAFAATNYDLYVGSTQVTSENAGNITGAGIEGTVSYDAGTNTLTLNNATITSHNGNEGIQTQSNGLNIKLIGSNTVEGQYNDGDGNYGIYVRGALTFSGDGNLTVSSEQANQWSAPIAAYRNITINHDNTIIAICKSTAGNAMLPRGNGKLILNNAKVTASQSTTGAIVVDYDGDPTHYKYLKIEPAVTDGISTVVVGNGSGGGNYVDGQTVTITANAPAAGKQFKEWTGADDLEFTGGTSKTSSTAKFIMPARAVEVTATYEDVVAEPPATEYDLWVGSTRVTSVNAGNVLDDGTVFYDESTKTLTLNGTSITSHNQNAGIRTESSDLNIELIGANDVVGQYNSGNANYGIYIEGKLTITGSGILNVSSAQASYERYSVPILAQGDIVVSHYSQIIAVCNSEQMESYQCAISPEGSQYTLKLDDAKVTASTSSALENPVIYCGDSVENLSSYKYIKIEPNGVAVTPETYTVTVNGGSGSGSYAEGSTVTITADSPVQGKQFKEWTGVDGLAFVDGTSATSSTAKFTMPANAVNVTATYEDDDADPTPTPTPDPDPTPAPSTNSSSKPKYSATLNKDADTENGDISFDQTRVKAGNKVTITVNPEDGYELGKLVILDKDGNKIEFTDNGDGTYTFVMPKGGVEVEPFFEKVQGEQKPEKEKSTLVLFVDKEEYLLGDETKVNDVAPVIKKNRTTLPVRLVAETLGAKVDWNKSERIVTITKGDKEIVIQIGQDYALVNGTKVKLDSSAYIDNNRTYMPVRFVAEALDAEVKWDENNRSVTIVEK